MFRWANRHTYVLLLPAFLLAGCATGYHRNIHNVPDWEAEDSANAPSEIASPPTVASGSRGVAPLQDPQAPVASAPAALVQPPSPIQTNIAPAAPISSPSKPVISKPPEPTPTWVQLGRWCKEHNLPPPRASLFGNQPTFSITTAGGVFTLHLGTTVATWQGVQLWLGFVPRLIDGQPALHALDV